MFLQPLGTQLDYMDIFEELTWISSSTIVLVALVILYLVYGKKAWLIPTIGAGVFWVGAIIDIFDEFFKVSEWFDKIGSHSKLAGYALFALGLIFVVRQLALMANIDPLTGIHNRRFLLEITEKEIERARRNGQPLAIVFVDVDKFKQINDSFGHIAGDSVLRNLADRMRENIRTVDFIARFGGDEFVIVMPNTNLEDGMVALLRFKKAIANLKLLNGQYLQISLGIAQYPDDGKEIDQLLTAASKRMYENKLNLL